MEHRNTFKLNKVVPWPRSTMRSFTADSNSSYVKDIHEQIDVRADSLCAIGKTTIRHRIAKRVETSTRLSSELLKGDDF
ncbi:hypothetical protein PPTG_23846 [Phytophthora nicotianae INRA-310]|uniref:Uncharacterized protein n=4 Tax=Phytophthora nicotianae TaxID=4792 RepID=W2PQD4_PHYN3|nr:hypothetical protein PPTG_23846 [Phytophthora nicotianae INRA-310]ETN02826.1 hypothetical protein PPTG_23846 [Phytophthora nicotianae INRA-310]